MDWTNRASVPCTIVFIQWDYQNSRFMHDISTSIVKWIISRETNFNFNFNFNFKRLYSTQIYEGKAKTCVLHSNVWRLLLRYMHTACIRATKKIIDWMTFILHTITYDQRNQTSYTDAQNLSQWRTLWIMGHEWFDVMRKYKGSGKSNSVQYKIYKPIYRLYEIAGACYWAKLSR